MRLDRDALSATGGVSPGLQGLSRGRNATEEAWTIDTREHMFKDSILIIHIKWPSYKSSSIPEDQLGKDGGVPNILEKHRYGSLLPAH